MMNRSLNNEHVLQVSDYSTVADAFGPLDGGLNGATGVHSAGEQPRPRRLLDVQFDLLESQEYRSDDHSDGDDDDNYGDYEENYQAE
ncbi:LTV1-like protein, partial [Trifolium medium]|nr:LTV1-like protein [Trifolium medium]